MKFPKMNLNKIGRSVLKFTSQHGTEILTAFGVAGMVGAVVSGIRVTPTAVRILEQADEDFVISGKKENTGWQTLPKKEIVKLTWKYYIPTALMVLTSASCMIFSTRTSLRRNAALAAAYTLSEANLRDYMEKTLQEVGPKREENIRAAVAQEKLNTNPVEKSTIVLTGKGELLCYDPYSGRYFKSSVDHINKSLVILNRDLLSEMYMSLNDLYRIMDLPDLDENVTGDELGWNVEWIGKDLIEARPTTRLATDGTPCYVMDFNIRPRINFA